MRNTGRHGRRNYLRIAGLVAAVAVIAGLGAVAVAQAASSVHRCYAQDVIVLFSRSGAAAGSTYQRVDIVNHGPECTFKGFPGVSFKDSLAGQQIGGAASRTLSGLPPRLVTMADGSWAHFRIRISDQGDFPPSACGPATARALGFYLPGDRLQHVLAGRWAACRKIGILAVSPVRAGS